MTFLRLGLTSFGGPVAHIGYFRREFVERRKWLSEADYASIVGICQFLPGPASSQTGFYIGLLRAGLLGGLAAWTGFTLPSAVLMYGLSRHVDWLIDTKIGETILHGLQLAAISIVTQAVWTMVRGICRDIPTSAIAFTSFTAMTNWPSSWGQITILIIAAISGYLILKPKSLPQMTSLETFSSRVGALFMVCFLFILIASFLPFSGNLKLFAVFYRTGAMVFGGGHVVLPLLTDAIVKPGWLDRNLFLAGYGAAQAVPGPLFTISAYVGSLVTIGSGGWVGAMIALIAIFLPGLLLVSGVSSFWPTLRGDSRFVAMSVGINAAAVGLLLFALSGLLSPNIIRSKFDIGIFVAGLVALAVFRTPPLFVVMFCILAAGVI